jgi:Zn-dependent metalloprotease
MNKHNLKQQLHFKHLIDMCKNHLCPVHCIIPPYMLDKLEVSGFGEVSDLAVNSRFRSHRFRSDRLFFQNTSVRARRILGLTSGITGPPVLGMAVYDNGNRTDFTQARLLWDSSANNDVTSQDALNVIAGGKASWNFYYQLFGRNSIDNKGLKINQYIHYDYKLDNAYWDGRRMVYGDGDGKVFASFTSDIDVIGHELTHGVTQNEANLEYSGQSGALNESFSDIFGIMIKQRWLSLDVKQSDWLIGENVLIGDQYALRSMKAPGTAYVNHPQLGTDPQPATMDKYVNMPDTAQGDYGGVHINSGIPNYAFYVSAFNMGGYSWEKAGRIWYSVLTDPSLSSSAQFTDVKNLTIATAEKLYGAGSQEAASVMQGWDAAKV